MDATIEKLIKIIQQMPEKDRYKLYQVLERRYPLEKRSSQRLEFNTTAGYTSLECFGNDLIQDISAGGVFLKTETPMEVGRPITLTIPSTDSTHHVKVHGEVARITNEGVGIRFTRKD